MAVEERRILFRPGRIHASGRSVGGIRTGGGQGQGVGKGGGVGGGRGTGKGHGGGLANLQQLVTLLAATSSTAGAVVPSPDVPGALTLLSTNTRATDGTIDIQSIPQTYSDLVLVGIVRGTDAGSIDQLNVRVNNDSGANYYFQGYYANAGTNNPAQSLGSTFGIACQVLPAAGAAASMWCWFTMEIDGYTSTTWVKNLQTSWASLTALTTGTSNRGISGNTWNNTAALNRLTFFGNTTANLKTAATIRVYGRS